MEKTYDRRSKKRRVVGEEEKEECRNKEKKRGMI